LVKPADVVDHIEPHNGDYRAFWFGPVRSLCRLCHEKRHGRANDKLWFGPDGWPLPPEQQVERERQRVAGWQSEYEYDDDDRFP
jgi:hypothetical protein